MAEGVGFEPTSPFGEAVFKTAALNHSAIPPQLQSTFSQNFILTDFFSSTTKGVGCAQSLRSLRLPFGSPNPRPLVLGHYVPSASPLELQGVAGRIPLQAGRLKPLGSSSEALAADYASTKASSAK